MGTTIAYNPRLARVDSLILKFLQLNFINFYYLRSSVSTFLMYSQLDDQSWRRSVYGCWKFIWYSRQVSKWSSKSGTLCFKKQKLNIDHKSKLILPWSWMGSCIVEHHDTAWRTWPGAAAFAIWWWYALGCKGKLPFRCCKRILWLDMAKMSESNDVSSMEAFSFSNRP